MLILTTRFLKLSYNVSAAWRGCGRLKTEHANANTKITLNLKTMIPNTKLTRNLAKLMLALVLFTSCETISNKKLKSSNLELRQLIQETKTTKYSSASFFLIAGGYSQSEYKETKVKVFAKVDGRFRLIEMPIQDVRININNKLNKPNIVIEYEHTSKFTDEELVSREWFGKVYVINCPEQYLPEKLLPIGL